MMKIIITIDMIVNKWINSLIFTFTHIYEGSSQMPKFMSSGRRMPWLSCWAWERLCTICMMGTTTATLQNKIAKVTNNQSLSVLMQGTLAFWSQTNQFKCIVSYSHKNKIARTQNKHTAYESTGNGSVMQISEVYMKSKILSQSKKKRSLQSHLWLRFHI